MKKKIILFFLIFGILVVYFLTLNHEKNSSEDTTIDLDSNTEEVNWSTYETYELELTQETTITKQGIYHLTGTIKDESVIINTSGNVKLILDNVSITNSDGPAIYIEEAKLTYIELKENTTNTIIDGGSNTDLDGAIFSKDDLWIGGTGTLKVTSNNQDGIVSKGDLVIESGTIIIDSEDDGIRGKDSIIIKDGNITITSNGDGIKTTNEEDTSKGNILIEKGTFDIKAELDGIQATANLQIDDGEFKIKTGDGSSTLSTTSMWGKTNSGTTDSMKDLKATLNIQINGGSFNLNTEDDSIHSNQNITITNGTFEINSGDDGIHADNIVTIKDGTIDIQKSYEGIEGTQINISNGNIKIVSSDDGINIGGGNDSSSMNRPGENHVSSDSEYKLTISGGTIYVNASGDGLDSNGNIYMSGGTVNVDGPTNDGNGALDYDGEFVITGGTLICVGSSGMAMSPSNNSTQNSALIYLSSTSSGEIKIGDITYTPSKNYSSILISSDQLEIGETYSVQIKGNTTTTFKQNSVVTTSGNSFNNPGMKR